MKIEAKKVVTLEYDLYVDGEELMEKATAEAPLVYCHGEGMMLPAFEKQMEGLAEGEGFDFCIACQDAYGEYDDEGVLTLDKKMFYNGDGEFDSERVYVGAIVPMNTMDGQVINAQIAEITIVMGLNFHERRQTYRIFERKLYFGFSFFCFFFFISIPPYEQ